MKTDLIHIFYGLHQHLNPPLIESIVKNSRYSHFFIIYLESKGEYVITQGDKAQRVGFYRKNLEYIKGQYLITNSFFRVILFLAVNNKPFIMHSDNFFMNLKLSNILFWVPSVWVCWGSVQKINDSRNDLKQQLKNFLKKKLVNNFSEIVCLMKPDTKEMGSLFKKKPVWTLPYISNSALDSLYTLENQIFNNNNKILVGNSGHYLEDYIEVLDVIKKFKSDIKVTFMGNYGLKKDKNYYKLLHEGCLMFGEDFNLDEKFYNNVEYSDFIHSFGIYICNVEKQTGLGIIDLCLQAGIKIYLAGNNYEWIKENGYIVYNYHDIVESNLYEFLQPLSHDEKVFNFKNFYSTRKNRAEAWDYFYSKIITG